MLVVPFDEIDYKYFCQEYKVSEEKSCYLIGRKLIMKIEFSDDDLKGVMEREGL